MYTPSLSAVLSEENSLSWTVSVLVRCPTYLCFECLENVDGRHLCEYLALVEAKMEDAVCPEREKCYARYLLCLNSCRRKCLEESFCLLFHSWAQGRSYGTLLHFCVEALGWRKEDILKLFSAFSGGDSVTCSSSVSIPSSPLSIDSSVFLESPCAQALQRLSRGINGTAIIIPPTSCVEAHLMKPRKSPFQRSFTTSAVSECRSLPHPAAKPRRSTMFSIPASRADIQKSLEASSPLSGFQNGPGHERDSKQTHLSTTAQESTDGARRLGESPEVVTTPAHGKRPLPIPRQVRRAREVPELEEKPSHVLSVNPIDLLKAEPNTSHLAEEVLVIMVTEMFPQMPARLQDLLARLTRLSRTVCYLDNDFDQLHLDVRVQDLLELTGDIINVVVEKCLQVIAEQIADLVQKLKISRKRLTQCKKEYKEHMSLVAKTREELDEAQRELQHAQRKDQEVKKNIRYIWSRSSARESHGGNVRRQQSIVADVPPEGESLSSVAYISQAVIYGDSGSTSLADDGEVGGYEADAHDSGLEGSNISLLTSVMKEVAVIERRHSRADDVDRKLQKVLRSTRQSVLLTKKQMCERLDSNVSAEQECIDREDTLNLRRSESARLKDSLRKLKKQHASVMADRNAVISRMSAAAEVIRSGQAEEGDITNGLTEIHLLRGERSNKILMEARREAVSFASRMKVFSVQEWLVRKQYARQEVTNVFSSLKVKGSKDSVGVLDLLKEDGDTPSVIVISGPKGSGKTCLCHYILHEWKSNETATNSRLRETDLVLYAALSDVVSSGSWARYLREHVLCYSLRDYSDSSIHEELKGMNVLFLLDTSGAAGGATRFLEEILQNLGRNRLVLTTRSGSEMEYVQRVLTRGVRCISTEMCPMTPQAVSEYAAQYLRLSDPPKNSGHVRSQQFTGLISSLALNPNVLYPLPLTYLLYLWSIDPTQVLFSTSVSSLFSRVVGICQQRLTGVLKDDGVGDKGAARLTVDENLQRLYRAAKELMTDTSWPYNNRVLLQADHHLFKDPRVLLHLSPFVVLKEGAEGKKQGFLVHSSLADVLCGFFFANTLLLKARRRTLVFRRPKLSNLYSYDLKRLRDVLLHVAGSFSESKHTLDDAKDLVSLYQKSLYENDDMAAWLTLLRECNFTTNVCEAVAFVLSSVSTWVISRHSSEINCVVAEMLRRGAYRPKLVVVTPDARDKEQGKGVYSIIHALGTCPNTLVHLRQEAQFYTWGGKSTCDDLVAPLQPPGTLRECWGHLGPEGALAIRHSHYLEELNVRITSVEALTALTHSISSQKGNLKYLYLRLDLPTSTPASSFQPINFKGKEFWLRFRGITDASETWVRDVTKKLNSWYSEIVLEESQLSPSVLHDLKQFMGRTPFHVSE